MQERQFENAGQIIWDVDNYVETVDFFDKLVFGFPQILTKIQHFMKSKLQKI